MKTCCAFKPWEFHVFIYFLFFCKCVEVPKQIPGYMNYMEAFNLLIYSTHFYGTGEVGGNFFYIIPFWTVHWKLPLQKSQVHVCQIHES